MATEKVTLSTNTIYGVVTAITVIVGIVVVSVIYLSGREISALEERCRALESKVEYLDSIVKERDGASKELFDAKLEAVRQTSFNGTVNKALNYAQGVHNAG